MVDDQERGAAATPLPATPGAALPEPERIRTAFPDIDPAALEAERIHRFVLGIDDAVRPMSDGEVAEELNDPFGRLLLRQGVFPTTLAEILSAIDAAIGDETENPLRRQMSFLVGEGTQIPWSEETAAVQRGLRLVVTRGRDNEIDLMISTDASGLTNHFLQVVGWDRESGVFHFYERQGDKWVWAGNSTHALDPRSRGRGPFDSHVNGSLVMKELKAPWTHWLSVDASVQPDLFPPDDPIRSDPLFEDASGAEVFEQRVVKPGIRRWTDSRFRRTVSDADVQQADALLRQLFTTTAVNLVSAGIQSSEITASGTVELPPSFFLDSDAMINKPLELSVRPNFVVPGEHYLAVLDEFDVALVDQSATFRQKGDTHFAFLVPERAFEDVDVVRKCVEENVLSQRFVACALMVDFPNAVFSERRAALARLVPASARRSGLEQELVAAIERSAAETEANGSEREFLDMWELGEAWRDEAQRRLEAYIRAVEQKLQTRDGFTEIFRLAESRRNRVRELDIAERRPLLFARTNLEREELELQSDASLRQI